MAFSASLREGGEFAILRRGRGKPRRHNDMKASERQTVEQLNGRYGAPGRIVFRTGFAGYPNVVIANRYGTAEVSLLGANVLSYRPTGLGEVIFRPAKPDSEYNRGDKFHGGVPVCWPQFGNRFSKDLPQHGFASVMAFEVRGTEYSEDVTEITLGLKSDLVTKTLWPHEFDFEVKVSVSMKLNLSMTTKNAGDRPFDFSCGFHPYFRLRNRDDASLRGLDGCEFVDAAAPVETRGTQSGDFRLDHAPDHVFWLKQSPRHAFAVLDPGSKRAIAIASSGNDRLVVWNSGNSRVVDLAEDDWRRYVCVEPVSDWPGGRTLAPGESHVLSVAIQAHLDGAESS